MPLQKGVGLNNQERLFPSLGRPCEEYEEDPIRPGTNWALHRLRSMISC
jgi:hypothetical protein